MRGIDIEVVTRDRDLDSDEPFPNESLYDSPCAHVHYVDATNTKRLTQGVIRKIAGRNQACLYLNSLFDISTGLAPLLLARLGLVRPDRIVLATRGQLLPQALQTHSLRKALLFPLIRALLLPVVDVYHATSSAEVESIHRMVDPRADVQLIPTALGVEPTHDWDPQPGRLVFVGRVVPHKNVHTLILALMGADRPIHLVIIGPFEEPEYAAECTRLQEQLPAHVTVEWMGSQPPAIVQKQLARAAVFVHPSLSENFGHSIAEALQTGCPVVVGADTPWTVPIEKMCPSPGIALPDPKDSQAVWLAIKSFLDTNHQDLTLISANARSVVSQAVPDDIWERHLQLFFPDGSNEPGATERLESRAHRRRRAGRK